MKTVRSFEEYMREGIAKRSKIEKQRAKSLVLESERKMNSLNERLLKLGINEGNANDYVEYCYGILMELIRAKLCLDGYSTGGQGAHEAEVSYLRFMGIDENDIRFADQMRYFRNGIFYYGTSLDAAYAEKVVEFTKRMHPKLKEIVSKGGLR